MFAVDGSSKMVPVTEGMMAQDLCFDLASRFNQEPWPNWTIVEKLPSLHLGNEHGQNLETVSIVAQSHLAPELDVTFSFIQFLLLLSSPPTYNSSIISLSLPLHLPFLILSFVAILLLHIREDFGGS